MFRRWGSLGMVCLPSRGSIPLGLCPGTWDLSGMVGESISCELNACSREQSAFTQLALK
jgi:hypothetical protein